MQPVDVNNRYAPTLGRKLQITLDTTTNNVRTLHVKQVYSDKELCELFKGKIPTESAYDIIIQSEDTDVYDHNTGVLICKFRTKRIAKNNIELARSSFCNIDENMKPSLTRNEAAGPVELEKVQKHVPNAISITPQTLNMAIAYKYDGTPMSKQVCNPVNSYLAGNHFDRYKSIGYETGFSKQFPKKWNSSLPFFGSIYDVLKEELPEIHKIHQKQCDSHRNLCIPNTNLTSVACNVNYWHKDRNDLKEGYSTLTVIEEGKYSGGYFIFAAYRIAVDVREGDVLLNQSHAQYHGNAPIEKNEPNAKRISFVTYLKKTIKRAKNAESSETFNTSELAQLCRITNPFCYCGERPSGKMVLCDNKYCRNEWFHLSCVGMSVFQGRWYCKDCDSSVGSTEPPSLTKSSSWDQSSNQLSTLATEDERYKL